MGTTIKALLSWAWSIFDITWWNEELKNIYIKNQMWIWKHTRWLKKHFDKSYNKIISR